MNSLMKLTSILVVLIIFAGTLVSCFTPGTVEKQRDKYVATVEIKFSTDDSDMKDAVDAVSSSVSTVYADGDKLQVDTSAAIDGISLDESYIYIDGTLYRATDIKVDDKSASLREKAAMSADDREQLLSDIGAGASIEVIDFNIQERNGEEGNYSYTCSRITSKAKESLCNLFASKFDGLNATVELSGAEYTLKMADGRNESSVLTCHFVIGLNGQSYEITMEICTEYDYDAEVNISAPADSEKYADVSYEDIIG